MPVQVQSHFSSIATDPLRNFKFQVNINHQSRIPGRSGIVSLGFVSVGGLSVTTESIPYRQGGMNTTVQQIPGQTTFTPITLQRGVIVGTPAAWDWMKELFSVVAGNGTGKRANNFRSNMEILVLDHPVTDDTDNSNNGKAVQTDVKMRFKVFRCWPTHIGYTDLNAGENALFIEQLTLMHEGFDVSWGSAPVQNGAQGTPGSEAAPFTVF